MRRIIERVVTVVTTTTWTITWQDDTPRPDLQAGPASEEFPKSDVSHQRTNDIQKTFSVIRTKEADVSETEKSIDQMADEPPDKSCSNQSKKGNKKS
ncbi:MAG TPA: hypothetical protein VJM08_12750 [Anaerolineales bacterium]|nr:hypothetical protein [Anaerolineales bacterium]